MTRRKRREYTDEFKNQMVQLFLSGKSRSEIIKEYELTGTAFDRWVKQSQVVRSGRRTTAAPKKMN